MSDLLGPDGQPVTPPAPQGEIRQLQGEMWGMAFVAQADGSLLLFRFDADAGDIATHDGGLPAPMFLLRCRPTERGHMVMQSIDDVTGFMVAEVDAVAELRRADAEVVEVAEAIAQEEADIEAAAHAAIFIAEQELLDEDGVE